jgi:hypothetical protein
VKKRRKMLHKEELDYLYEYTSFYLSRQSNRGGGMTSHAVPTQKANKAYKIWFWRTERKTLRLGVDEEIIYKWRVWLFQFWRRVVWWKPEFSVGDIASIFRLEELAKWSLLPSVDFLLGFLFDSEDRGDILLRNVGLPSHCTVLKPRILHSS